jgi:tetrahydromethanopterin S-methyltransferase subunit B
MERKLGNGLDHHASTNDAEGETAGYFLKKLESILVENFASIHDEIEELEEKINKLEKSLDKKQ